VCRSLCPFGHMAAATLISRAAACSDFSVAHLQAACIDSGNEMTRCGGWERVPRRNDFIILCVKLRDAWYKITL